MASVSQTETVTTSEKTLENKVKEKEIVLSETVEVVKDKPVTDSNLTVTKEEQIDQTPADEPEKESIIVVKAEESTEKGKDENGEKAVEQVELKEPVLEKDSVEEVIVKAVDEEKDENGEKKVAEQVELKEPTLVDEDVEEDNKDKEVVDISESTDEAIGKQVEPFDVQSVKDVSAENKIKDVEVLEVEPKPEASEKVETQPEKAKELAPEVEVVKAEETPDATEQAKGKLEDIIVENKDSGINLGAEKTSESVSSLCPEEIVPINQDSDIAPEKEPEGEVSSPADIIEKAITGEKHAVEDVQENVSEAKDMVSKLATEDEKIKKDNEPVSEGTSEETLKETDTESREKETAANKQEESITEKVAAVVKERDEPNQQPEVTAKKKQPNSILSKLKQSLVKAKKAIIGKSPKNISTEEAKGNVKD